MSADLLYFPTEVECGPGNCGQECKVKTIAVKRETGHLFCDGLERNSKQLAIRAGRV